MNVQLTGLWGRYGLCFHTAEHYGITTTKWQYTPSEPGTTKLKGWPISCKKPLYR